MKFCVVQVNTKEKNISSTCLEKIFPFEQKSEQKQTPVDHQIKANKIKKSNNKIKLFNSGLATPQSATPAPTESDDAEVSFLLKTQSTLFKFHFLF